MYEGISSFLYGSLPTIDYDELLREIPQQEKQEGWIIYLTHGNSKTAGTAGNCC